MKARALGRFVAEFLEGFAGESEPESARPEAPIVVQEDMVRRAVADFLKPMVDQAAAEDEAAPSGQQLDMMFDEARAQDRDDIAEMTLRRVHEAEELTRRREREATMGGAVPETFEPDLPGPKPWMGANLHREPIDLNTA